jgi:hypothetical protein
MDKKLICLKCGEEVYLEALVTLGGDVVTDYASSICSNSECVNSNDYAKYWNRIAKEISCTESL